MSRIDVTANSEVATSIQRTSHHSAPSTATASPRYQSHGGSGTQESTMASAAPKTVRSAGFTKRTQCRRVL